MLEREGEGRLRRLPSQKPAMAKQGPRPGAGSSLAGLGIGTRPGWAGFKLRQRRLQAVADALADQRRIGAEGQGAAHKRIIQAVVAEQGEIADLQGRTPPHAGGSAARAMQGALAGRPQGWWRAAQSFAAAQMGHKGVEFAGFDHGRCPPLAELAP